MTVNLKARGETAGDLAALMHEVSGRAVKDPGNQYYRVFRAHDDPTAFTIMEAWDREADFQAHMAADWVAEVNAKIGPLVEGEPTARGHSQL